MTDTVERECCPECDSLAIYHRVRSGGYRCDYCKARFETPAKREAPPRPPAPGSPYAQALIDADPEDYP